MMMQESVPKEEKVQLVGETAQSFSL